MGTSVSEELPASIFMMDEMNLVQAKNPSEM
jgi:hypothetical protein